MPADRALKTHLDSLLDEPEQMAGEPPDAGQEALVAQAVAAFRAAGPELLDTAAPHVWAYYRDEVEDMDPERRATIPDLLDDASIWDHVTLTEATIDFGGDPTAPATVYIAFGGEVTWEPEHGLDLVFAEGATVCKVGPCDGHSTNAAAYGDIELLDVVYVDRQNFEATVSRQAARDARPPAPEQPELPL